MTIGGHYTYQMMPLFDWIRDTFHLKRNHYDRLGHYLQGIAVALLARELLLRTSPLLPGKWLFFLVMCTCMAFSASFELIEFLAAKLMGGSAELYLGLQGDEWDPQWDMFCGWLGCITSLLVFRSYQNRHVWEAEQSRS
jgi:putative membrane protein